MLYIRIFLFATLMTVLCPTSYANKIIANVEGNVITDFDLNERIKLLLLAHPEYKGNSAIMEAVRMQVKDILIEDKLKEQYAKRANIVVDQKDLDNFIAQIQRNNKVFQKNIKKSLAQNSISYESFYSQVRAEFTWYKVLEKVIVPRISVSSREVEIFLQQTNAKRLNAESARQRIFEDKMNNMAKKFLNELKKVSFIEENLN